MVRFIPVLFLVACGAIHDNGGQQGEEGARCDVIATTVLERDEASVLGFSAGDVLAYADGGHGVTFTWADGSSTAAGADISDIGEIRYQDMEMVDDGSGIEPMLDCADVVAIDATVRFHTDDGAFDEPIATTLAATAAAEVGFYAEVDPQALGGAWVPSDSVDTSAYDEVRMFISGTFDAAGSTGTVDVQGSGTDGTGDEGVAWAENIGVGTWSP